MNFSLIKNKFISSLNCRPLLKKNYFTQVIDNVIDYRKTNIFKKNNLGAVFTMGNLHQGHIELVKKAKQINENVVVSIFINKKQFNENEDYNLYPRTLEKDIELLKSEKVDVIFTPDDSEMYLVDNSVKICPGKQFTDSELILDKYTLNEGSSRPGFFEGVSGICIKLFNIIQPTHVYFGEK